MKTHAPHIALSKKKESDITPSIFSAIDICKREAMTLVSHTLTPKHTQPRIGGKNITSTTNTPTTDKAVLVPDASANNPSILFDKLPPIIGIRLPTAVLIPFFVKLSADLDTNP